MNKYRHACESRVAIACQNNRLIIAMLGHGGIDNVKHQRIATGADPSRRLLMPLTFPCSSLPLFLWHIPRDKGVALSLQSENL